MGNHSCFLLCFAIANIQTILLDVVALPSTISRRGFSLPLIHRDSTHLCRHHPYNPNLVISTDMRGPLMPTETNTLFYVNVSIGEPPLPQLLIIDTGSDLSWVKCTPCTSCSKAVHPTYNPTKSSSFKSIPCDSESCARMMLESSCEYLDGECPYYVKYLDGSYSRGELAYEKFTFTTSDDGLIELPKAIFGCGRLVREPLLQSSGLFGLGYTRGSMLFQSNHSRFSYCLGNISDPNYQYNKLIIGDGAILQGDSIPLSSDSDESYNYYYIRADGINIGEKEIKCNEHLDFILDSGTSVTHLMKEPLDALKEEVRRLMDGLLHEHDVEGFLCYRGNMRRDLTGFPTITLSLSGGANLELDVEGAFWYLGNFKNSDVFCLAFAEAKGNRNIIGVIAQQYYNIGFDLKNRSVSLQRIDCQLFED